MSWGDITEHDVSSALGSLCKGNRNVWASRWKSLHDLIRPFEMDRSEYDNPSKYKRPALVEVHPAVMKIDSRIKVRSLALHLLLFVRPVLLAHRRKGTAVAWGQVASEALLLLEAP